LWCTSAPIDFCPIGFENCTEAMVAEYNLKLIDKKLSEQKLKDFKELLVSKAENENIKDEL